MAIGSFWHFSLQTTTTMVLSSIAIAVLYSTLLFPAPIITGRMCAVVFWLSGEFKGLFQFWMGKQ